jgi:hypothetical protein
MKYKIEVANAALSDGELYAAVLLIINLPGCPEHAKARAIRDLIPSITGHAHARMRDARDRTPIIKGPADPEPGLDKVWRLLWLS